ncbi:MAG: L,D-transpeptidase/peptidoglycan binding protein [Lachnospiraceae bacterium]|nr:L,D-transpeptidase/peptidoglycan binding protein [Lachnospiraceae bacterium]
MSSAKTGAKQKKNKYLAWKIIGVLLAVMIIASVTTYVVIASQYQDKFIEGTKINNFDVSNMQPQEVEELIREEVEDFDLTVTFRDGSKEVINGSQIDYHFVPDGSVQRFLDEQDPMTWLRGRLGDETVLEAEAKTSFDEEKLAAVVEAFPEVSGEGLIAPRDAYYEWQEDRYAIIPEIEGDMIQKDTLIEQLKEILAESGTSFIVPEETYQHPEIYSDNEALNARVDSANALVKGTVSIEMPGHVIESIGPNDLKEWIIDDQAGGYVLPAEVVKGKCRAFISGLAEKYDTYKKDIPFQSQNFGEIMINLSYHGWELDQEAVTEAFAEAILSHEDTQIEPQWNHQGFTMEADGIGPTYIECDIASQHVYYFINGELYMDTPVVTGTATSSERRTPTGVFLLEFKQKDRTLLGRPDPETGEPSYRSHVWFWMPFNGGVGFHDADGWRSRYGGTIFKYSGSHGCVNMPYKAAQKMYEMIDKETPIIVHWQR